MVFSENARKLESDLHKYFDEKRVTFNSIDKSSFGDFAETEEASVDF